MQIFHKCLRVEMAHIRPRLHIWRFMLSRLLKLGRAHLHDRFKRLSGAGFLIAGGFGGWLFGAGLGRIQFRSADGGVAQCSLDRSVTGEFSFLFSLSLGLGVASFSGSFDGGAVFFLLLGLYVPFYFPFDNTSQRFLFFGGLTAY